MKKLLIANFKQNKTKIEIEEYFLNQNFEGNSYCEVIIAPSFLHIDLVKTLGVGIEVAGQTVSVFPKGAYTGAVGAFQLKDLGVKYCIVGHSERRKYFGETTQVVNNQVRELEAVGVIPVICFSNLDEIRQLEVQKKGYYLAYEPIDAINTSGLQSCAYENDEIQKMIDNVKDIIGECMFIYGGSVDENDILRLRDISDLKGFLVGTASLDVRKFLEIYRKVI